MKNKWFHHPAAIALFGKKELVFILLGSVFTVQAAPVSSYSMRDTPQVDNSFQPGSTFLKKTDSLRNEIVLAPPGQAVPHPVAGRQRQPFDSSKRTVLPPEQAGNAAAALSSPGWAKFRFDRDVTVRTERLASPVPSVFKVPPASPTAVPPKNAGVASHVSEKASSSREQTTTDRNYLGPSLGPTRFSVNYEKTSDRSREKMARFLSGEPGLNGHDNEVAEFHAPHENWQLGVEYASGNGRINASLDLIRMKENRAGNAQGVFGGLPLSDSTEMKTFRVGYTYDVSDKTAFYGALAHTDYDKEALAGSASGNGFSEDSVTGVQFGVSHKF